MRSAELGMRNGGACEPRDLPSDPPFRRHTLLPPSASLLPHRSAASVAPPLLRGGATSCLTSQASGLRTHASRVGWSQVSKGVKVIGWRVVSDVICRATPLSTEHSATAFGVPPSPVGGLIRGERVRGQRSIGKARRSEHVIERDILGDFEGLWRERSEQERVW
jgi:hypothetical protein